MLQYFVSLRQFRLIKWRFLYINAPYVHLRRDSILELCLTFPVAIHLCPTLCGRAVNNYGEDVCLCSLDKAFAAQICDMYRNLPMAFS